MKTISCSAGYGSGGLGQHLTQLVEEARGDGTLGGYFSGAPQADDERGIRVETTSSGWVFQYTPVRFSPAWKNFLGGDLLDRAVAARLTPGETFHGFNGQALHSFRRAQALGYRQLVLESATTHVDHVMRQQRKAHQLFGWEAGWMNETQRRKTLREYALADTIYVASQLSYDTFREAGVPDSKLRRRTLTVDPRFVPPAQPVGDGKFRIVYVGSVSVMKGIPLLREAFSRLTSPDAELTLVGGWGTRTMKHYLRDWQRLDPRVHIAPGDPLPHLQRADVCVHPSFTDGFGLAPAEALACGVPVIVTEDTGMKDLVQEGVNGYIVPTGDWEAILERMEHFYQHRTQRVDSRDSLRVRHENSIL